MKAIVSTVSEKDPENYHLLFGFSSYHLHLNHRHRHSNKVMVFDHRLHRNQILHRVSIFFSFEIRNSSSLYQLILHQIPTINNNSSNQECIRNCVVIQHNSSHIVRRMVLQVHQPVNRHLIITQQWLFNLRPPMVAEEVMVAITEEVVVEVPWLVSD